MYDVFSALRGYGSLLFCALHLLDVENTFGAKIWIFNVILLHDFAAYLDVWFFHAIVPVLGVSVSLGLPFLPPLFSSQHY